MLDAMRYDGMLWELSDKMKESQPCTAEKRDTETNQEGVIYVAEITWSRWFQLWWSGRSPDNTTQNVNKPDDRHTMKDS